MARRLVTRLCATALCLTLSHTAWADAPANDAPVSAAPAAPADSATMLRPDFEAVGLVATPFAGGEYGLGFGMAFGAGWGSIPIALGADLMAAYWGSHTSDLAVGTGSGLLPATLRREDWTVFLDLWVRVQPPYWRVRPYLEGFVGTRVLQTSYSLAFVSSNTTTDVVSDSDWGGEYGWGAGIDLHLFADRALALTLGFRRTTGAKGSFSRVERGPTGDALVRYDVDTNTNLFLIGVSSRFDAPENAPAAPPR